MPEQANPRPIAGALTGWADHGHGSLAQRLAFAIRRLVEADLLPAGTVLPPERRLAVELAVSRSTVTAALDVLRTEGVLASRQGRGTVVVGADDRAGTATNRMADHFVTGAGGIDLAVGNPGDVAHLPPVSVDMADLLASGAGAGFQPLGLPAMRAALAELHTARGVHTAEEEIHVTSGAHQAISLAMGALVGRRASVALQVPNYPGAFDIFEGLGVRVVPVRADTGGLVPEALDEVLAAGVDVVYTVAGPHNPTGVVTGPARLRALAAVLDRHEATLVEDLTLVELAYAGRPAHELADLCRRATVVSIGSFSKVLWGGLRVGWIRAPMAVIDRTLHRRMSLDLGAPTPSQLMCLGLLPQLPEIAAGRRAALAGRTRFAAELLRAEIPEWDVPGPSGGSVLWIGTPAADAAPLVQFAHRHGVHVAPGSIAVDGRRADRHVRVCVDRPQPVLEAGLRRLVAAWREMVRRPTRVAG